MLLLIITITINIKEDTYVSVTRRFSKQRQIIYNAIKTNPVHPSADMIYNMLKEEYPELSLGTVYRNLNVLSDMGLIVKISSGLESEHYDGNTDNHYHFICTKCSKMFDIDIPYQANIVTDAQKNSSHKIIEHDIVFSGICESCCKIQL